MMNVGKVAVTTPSEREIALTRDFDAPRPLVFDCWTRPDLLKRWLSGPPGWSLAVCDVDLRPGGAYRFVWHGPGGAILGMGGKYREVVAPERLVNTQLFDLDWTGGEVQGTLVLTESGGATRTVNTLLYPSQMVRDAVLRTGMLHGMEAGHDRLDAMLEETPAP